MTSKIRAGFLEKMPVWKRSFGDKLERVIFFLSAFVESTARCGRLIQNTPGFDFKALDKCLK
jgi:hypothetical protein